MSIYEINNLHGFYRISRTSKHVLAEIVRRVSQKRSAWKCILDRIKTGWSDRSNIINYNLRSIHPRFFAIANEFDHRFFVRTSNILPKLVLVQELDFRPESDMFDQIKWLNRHSIDVIFNHIKDRYLRIVIVPKAISQELSKIFSTKSTDHKSKSPNEWGRLMYRQL